jgi:hypothetical protein
MKGTALIIESGPRELKAFQQHAKKKATGKRWLETNAIMPARTGAWRRIANASGTKGR